MKNTSKTIVFFGSGPVAAASLDFLAAHFDIEMVITKAIQPHYKGMAQVEELAKNLQMPITFASNKKELNEIMKHRSFKSRVGVVVDYGVIFSKEVINSFKLGVVNSHFSLLPQWRGADPITYSILSGQQKTGVSLMVIEPALDTGKLLSYRSLVIYPNETTLSLTKRLIELSNSLLVEYLPKYIDGQIRSKNQPHPDRATYSRKLEKADGKIDWQKPSIQIEREIRAYLGWPGSRTSINNNQIIIKKAQVIDNYENELTIQCGDGKYLSIDELIAPSGRTMAARDFINGYKLN
jgi:methionyl-tRNA formyltransferase